MAKQLKDGVPSSLKHDPATNLRRGNPGKNRKPKKLTPDQELFCVKRAMNKGVRTAAAEVGISEAAAWRWNREPLVVARVDELRPLIAEEIRQNEVGKFLLDVQHFDRETTRVASMQKPHRIRGFADKVSALLLGYRRMQNIMPQSSVTATATAGAQATANGATAKQVYKSRWMLENEEKMRMQLEAENDATGNPTP